MTIGGEEVRTEHLLLHNYESGEMMDSPESVRFLVIHCSATKASRNYTAKQLIRDHKARGMRTGGYHFYFRKDGTQVQFRKLLEVGAHARPYNRCSIGICYEGGLDDEGRPMDTDSQSVSSDGETMASEFCSPSCFSITIHPLPVERCTFLNPRLVITVLRFWSERWRLRAGQ